jgi:hypothetical protein
MKLIMKIDNFNSKQKGTFNSGTYLSNLLKLVLLIFLFQIINSKSSERKARDSQSQLNNNNKNSTQTLKKLPDDIEAVFRHVVDNKSRECMNEILFIYKKDYKEINTVKANRTLLNQEKFLNRTFVQISKKLNKYNFYEAKNFTGIRWVDPKSYPGEMKKLLENYFQHVASYFEKKYFNCQNSVPEFIIENYNLFFAKINEIKKIFSKFHLFKGIKKFFRCMMKHHSSYDPKHFGDNLLSGKITIKKLLISLKNIINALLEIFKGMHVDNFAKNLRRIILNLKGMPIF